MKGMRKINNNINIYFEKKIKTGLNIKKLIEKILEKEKKQHLDINIIFTDNSKIKQINLEYRNRNYPTDVISFPVKIKNGLIGGDIYISMDKIKENAKEYKTGFNKEFLRIIIHGILHILGYDHIKLKDKLKMFRKQENYLKIFYKGN